MSDDIKEKIKNNWLKIVILILAVIGFSVCVGMCTNSCTTVQTGSHGQPAPSQVNFNTSNSIEK